MPWAWAGLQGARAVSRALAVARYFTILEDAGGRVPVSKMDIGTRLVQRLQASSDGGNESIARRARMLTREPWNRWDIALLVFIWRTTKIDGRTTQLEPLPPGVYEGP